MTEYRKQPQLRGLGFFWKERENSKRPTDDGRLKLEGKETLGISVDRHETIVWIASRARSVPAIKWNDVHVDKET